MNVSAFKNTLVRLEVKETLIILTASVILPFTIHLVPPIKGAPLGAMLLPMFYAPLIAVLLFRPHVAIITGLLSPFLNSLLTGHPAPQIIGILTSELLLFSIIAYLINRKWRNFWGTALLAYLLSLSSVTILGLFISDLLPTPSPLMFFLNTVTSALPGLAALLLINIFLIHFKSKFNDD